MNNNLKIRSIMANLNFKIEGNSESFIKETEQIDSSIRTLATDIEKQEQKTSESFKTITASLLPVWAGREFFVA